MPLTDGHGVHRQVPLSALNARQRVVLHVLRELGTGDVVAVLSRAERLFPDLPLTLHLVERTLELLFELGHAEFEAGRWRVRSLTSSTTNPGAQS